MLKDKGLYATLTNAVCWSGRGGGGGEFPCPHRTHQLGWPPLRLRMLSTLALARAPGLQLWPPLRLVTSVLRRHLCYCQRWGWIQFGEICSCCSFHWHGIIVCTEINFTKPHTGYNLFLLFLTISASTCQNNIKRASWEKDRVGTIHKGRPQRGGGGLVQKQTW